VLLRRAATYVPPLLVGLLALPFIQRQNSWWEWNNVFWMLERQTEHVKAHGVPTFFLHNLSGAFNPFFVYYAGFTCSLLAYPAALFGAWPVFAASVVVAIVCGYLGIWWTARNLGLSAPLAVLPALIFATTPYVLSEMYGRGAWAELIAVNAVAVMLGALTALLWHPERRRLPAYAALVASAAMVCGTHNLTLLMAAVLLPLLLLVVLPLRPAGSAPLLPSLARAGIALALGAGLTAAWLIPNLWFGPSTWVSQAVLNEREFTDTHGQLALSNVLSPLPAIPDEFHGRWVFDQPPVTAMAWALLAFALIFALQRQGSRRVAYAVAGIVALAVALMLLIVHPFWWLHFPRLIKTVQFPFRLLPYLAMLTALATVLGLTVLRGTARRWMIGLLAVLVVVQIGGAVHIVTKSQAGGAFLVIPASPSDLPVEGEPTSFAAEGILVHLQFRVLQDPYGGKPNGAPARIDVGDLITGDVGKLTGTARAGARVMAPVVWSPFVRITGDARIVGRDAGGATMLAVTHTDPAGRWQAKAEAAHPWQVVLGRVISVFSAIAIVAYLIVLLVRRRRSGRAPAPRPAKGDVPADPQPAVHV
jgi:hypothetical protein